MRISRPASMTGFFILGAMMTLTCLPEKVSLAGDHSPFITETSFYTNKETNNRRCSDGKFHNLNIELVCASWDFNIGDYIRVTNMENGKNVKVEICDRGPAKRLYNKGRRLDLSKIAFNKIFDIKKGIGRVKVEKL